MHKPTEYKVGVVNESPIRIYKYDDELVKKHSLSCPYFLDGFEVTKMIGKQIETLNAFISAENDRKSIRRNILNKQRKGKTVNITTMSRSIEISNSDGLKQSSPRGYSTVAAFAPVSFEVAALYWLQYAIMGSSLALQISRSIIDKSLEKVASEIYWKKTILDKQLQIQEAVKIAKQEECIINAHKMINKKGETVYTLDAAIEKARIIMRLESTTDTKRIIESGTSIQHTNNQVVRLMTPTISKDVHDAIMDVANRYRQVSSQKAFNVA